MFGKPQWVQADVLAQRNPDKAEDYFHITFGYELARVQLYSRSIVLNPGPRYQIHGLNGSYMKHGMDRQEEDLKAGKNPLSDEWGVEEKENWGRLTTLTDENVSTVKLPSEKGDYTQFYKGIFGAIRENHSLPVNPGDALEVIKLIEACKKSSDLKRTVYLD